MRSGVCLSLRESLRDPDQDVPHGVAVAEDQHFVRYGCRVLLGTRGVGVHGERLESGGFPVEGDDSGDGRGGEGDARPEGHRDHSSCQPQPVPCPAHARLLGHCLPPILDLADSTPGPLSAQAAAAATCPTSTFSNASDSASLGSRSGTSACRRISQPAAATKQPPTARSAATSSTDGRSPSGWSVGMTCQ